MALFSCWLARLAFESGSYSFRWIQCPPRQQLAIKCVPYPLHANERSEGSRTRPAVGKQLLLLLLETRASTLPKTTYNNVLVDCNRLRFFSF